LKNNNKVTAVEIKAIVVKRRVKIEQQLKERQQ
jgi:hypothetical protein